MSAMQMLVATDMLSVATTLWCKGSCSAPTCEQSYVDTICVYVHARMRTHEYIVCGGGLST